MNSVGSGWWWCVCIIMTLSWPFFDLSSAFDTINHYVYFRYGNCKCPVRMQISAVVKLTLCREKRIVGEGWGWGCFLGTKKKGSTSFNCSEYPWNIWNAFTRVIACLIHFNCEHSCWLLLLRAGISTECCQSYMLLCCALTRGKKANVLKDSPCPILP